MSLFRFLVKNIMLYAAVFAFACTASSLIMLAPATASASTLKVKLQDTLDDARNKSKVKGVSTAIIMANSNIWLGVSGMSDPTIEEQITQDMLFDLCSIGKNYVAVLILKLVEEGHLTLDDPLNKWLPAYQNIDKNISIRQMLNHTSGIYDFVKHPRSPFQTAYKTTKVWKQEQIISELVDKPYFSPGNGWHYSTTNYVLLRMIVEKATRSKLSDEIYKRFLGPLDLDGTISVDPLSTIPPGTIIANNWIGDIVDLANRPQPWTATSPHLIYATAEDSAKWMHLIYHEKKVLKQQLLDQMLDFHSPTPNDPPLSGYGLGVMFIDFELAYKSFGLKGVRMWGHGGSTLGFRSIVMYLPDHGITISVLINGDEDEGLINIFIGLLKVVLDESSQ